MTTLLVSGATATLRALAGSAPVGHLITPHTGNRIDGIATSGRPWAADNGCGPKRDGSAGTFDEAAFLAMCEQVAYYCDHRHFNPRTMRRPLWVAVPDVVGDAYATSQLWEEWAPRLDALRLPLAYVVQDGYHYGLMPQASRYRLKCAFLGGSTEFKESDEARAILRGFRSLQCLIHIGRVNSERRLAIYDDLDTHNGLPRLPDTIDGTQFSMFPETYIPRWAERLKPSVAQPPKAFDVLPMFAEASNGWTP
jgi:hypothetical protein